MYAEYAYSFPTHCQSGSRIHRSHYYLTAEPKTRSLSSILRDLLADVSIPAKSQPKRRTSTCPPNTHKSKKRHTRTISHTHSAYKRHCANLYGTSIVETDSLAPDDTFDRNSCLSMEDVGYSSSSEEEEEEKSSLAFQKTVRSRVSQSVSENFLLLMFKGDVVDATVLFTIQYEPLVARRVNKGNATNNEQRATSTALARVTDNSIRQNRISYWYGGLNR